MIKKPPIFQTAYTDNPSIDTNTKGESLTVQADAQFLDIRYIINQHIASNTPLDNARDLQYADISKLKTLPEYMDTLNEITDVYNNLSPEHARQYASLDSFINAMIQHHSKPPSPTPVPSSKPQKSAKSSAGEGGNSSKSHFVQTDINDVLDDKKDQN